MTICGPVGESPPLIPDLDLSQVERLCAAALAEPSRHAATRFLIAMLPEVGSDLPGLRNAGLVATQELRHGVPARHDWHAARDQGKRLLGYRGRALIERLGFGVELLTTTSAVLTVAGAKRAVAIFLDEGESFEESGARFGTSAVSHALALADRESLPWVVLTRARQIRLYAAHKDVGVGRKGRAETFVEIDLALLPADLAGYLPLMFGAEALAERGTFGQILERSADFAAELGARLRDRVYFDAVPLLATVVARRLHTPPLTESELTLAYEETLIILFRLLFVAYAEDKDLLPYRTNSRYNDHSLKRLARRLAEWRQEGGANFDQHATDLWDDVEALWQAVDKGNTSWGVPAYNGGLFSDAAEVTAAGAGLSSLSLTDDEFGPPLTALLVDVGPDEVIGPVDFRSLSVREFGTIYEGLLESRLSVAESDLTIDSSGSYVPATSGSQVVVQAGDVYFHNRSGSRKTSGSYFTKPFAVEHLLDGALEQALLNHLSRLTALVSAGDDAAAAEAFFDFRCADLAMGSGHFLVAAVDRIEARLSGFLALNPIPRVLAELQELRAAAVMALGALADGVEIETTSLLRRQVARRCIYGVDINLMAVELARLAIWIHTFVPGLPLSFLDHNLVEGDSLTGIGTVDEAVEALEPHAFEEGQFSIFYGILSGFLARAEKALRRLAATSDATRRDIAVARAAHAEALIAVEPARQLFDILVAARVDETTVPVAVDEQEILRHAERDHASRIATRLRALHFPVSFPEVFLRERPGFDCILGNPPWETVKSEEHKFWGLRFPGLRGSGTGEMNQAVARLRFERPDLAQEYEAQRDRDTAFRRLLLRGPYPGLGTGDPDLSEVFAWRILQLTRLDGWFGAVLPRSVFMAAGSALWRSKLFSTATVHELLTLVNTSGWAFDDVHHQWTVALVSTQKTGTMGAVVHLRGPYRSLLQFQAGVGGPGATLATSDVLMWTPGAALPLLPSERAAGVYRKLRSHPSLVSDQQPWRVRTYNELHATADKAERGGIIQMRVNNPAGMWPVYKGDSFSIWEPSTGKVYGWAAPTEAVRFLMQKRTRQVRTKRSPFFGMSGAWARDPDTLPCQRPRIAWRMVGRATDARSFYAALLPPHVLTAHHNYCLFFPYDEHERDEAYLLGIMCSIPFDWHARLWVEANFTANVVEPFPIPALPSSHPVRHEIERIAGRLAAVDERYADWAAIVDAPVGTVEAGERTHLVARLDALVALAYGLSTADVEVVFETFHVGWDYRARLKAALREMERLA